MYVLDPQNGHRRRRLAYDRGTATLRHSARRVERSCRHLGADAMGMVQRVRHLRQGPPVAVDDQTLVDRVRSEILRNPTIPAGRINVNVEDGIVILRGQLDRLDQIRSLTEDAKRVRGVRDVVNYLHLPDTLAPNKEAAFSAGHDVVLATSPAAGTDEAAPHPS
jgi:hypothetical protein